MNREEAKPKRDREMESLNDGSILPDDKELANRYIEWKNLFDKYNKPNEDEDGMAIDDAIQRYAEADGNDQKYTQLEEALECSTDDDDKACSKSDYAALKNQLTSAVKKRNTEWKNNGMEEIFNSNFSLGVDYVQKWLADHEHGTAKQVTQERETRFTEYNGKSQMDVTHRENISILNDTDRKQLTSEHCSNYEFCDNDQRRVIVHQVEKTTISSFITVDPSQSNGTGGTIPKLPMNSFFGNVFTPFKYPHTVEKRKPLTNGKFSAVKQLHGRTTANNSIFDSGTLISLMENSLKIVPKSCVANDVRKKSQKPYRKRRVHFKQSKTKRQIVSDSSESSDSETSSKADDSEEELQPNISKLPCSMPVRVNSKEQSIRCISLLSESSDNSLCETKVDPPSPPTGTTLRNDSTYTDKGNEKLSKDIRESAPTQTGQKYPMPANYRQMLAVNGRCRYKTDGTIIYRPKPIHAGLPKDAEKIVIQTQDLDLSGIKSNDRRKKFANFSCQAHPNSVLVYYMSDSDDELFDALPVRDSDEDSSEDDDPILSYKPQLCILTFFNDGKQTG
ncbi:uncharacterized protein LOC125763447 [Anopheles funestus]|uniref:uncharacterized protein LOC125763447 n=1 Tax=Anopheles funestus TaxID=62324 RepID=UPI0020C7148F|nr:uncharacterized protein LOC125763447 [Anopheles funestus]